MRITYQEAVNQITANFEERSQTTVSLLHKIKTADQGQWIEGIRTPRASRFEANIIDLFIAHYGICTTLETLQDDYPPTWKWNQNTFTRWIKAAANREMRWEIVSEFIKCLEDIEGELKTSAAREKAAELMKAAKAGPCLYDLPKYKIMELLKERGAFPQNMRDHSKQELIDWNSNYGNPARIFPAVLNGRDEEGGLWFSQEVDTEIEVISALIEAQEITSIKTFTLN